MHLDFGRDEKFRSKTGRKIPLRQLLLFLILLCMVIPSEKSDAQQPKVGFGFILGEPTGISIKYWTSKTTAFDFGLGVSIGGDRIAMDYGQYYDGSRIHFHFDYLLHVVNVIGSTDEYPIYYGLGVRFNSGGGYNNSLAVRFVTGLAWMPTETPIDMFVEFVPSLQLTPQPGFAIDSAIGVRYYF
jgi:hypothetical protein